MKELACDHWDDPFIAGLFGKADDEATRHNKLTFFENQLLAYAIGLLSTLQVERARDFLHRGFAVRLMMMQRSRIYVRSETIDRVTPLDPYLAGDLALHVNAYYLNLSGALDNLAWAISFELRLSDSLDEDSWDSRRFCGLASPPFKAALAKARPSIAGALGRVGEWADKVKQFRDPAAHRLPLLLVGAMLTPDDVERHRELTELAAQAVLADDLERWSQIVAEREALGSFLPILSAPRGPEGELIVAPNQMAADQVDFLKTASLLLSRSFDPDNGNASAV